MRLRLLPIRQIRVDMILRILFQSLRSPFSQVFHPLRPVEAAIRTGIGGMLLLASFAWGEHHVKAPDPFGPTPSKLQLRWQEMEYYAFIHFSLNTYTDQSWGFGDEDVELFDPKDLDCREWARICKEAGMKGIILTAKHHCGFCLWPSAHTEYSVKNAPWKDGKGDVVRELAEACQEYGLKFGVYLSPWDRNHPEFGRPEYITYFRKQLTELLSNYGPIFEVWFDGAHGGDGYYGGAYETRNIDRTTYYDWQNTYKLVRQLQPDIVIWNDGGDRADLRWVGTEEGYVGDPNWSLLNAAGEVEWRMLHYGLESGDAWVPAEVNTSIRPEWFYHPVEDTKVKTVPQLLDTYYHSVGRNATLLLNFPIMPNGRIHSKDESVAVAFARAVKDAFAENLVSGAIADASNVRGGLDGFAAANAVDGDTHTYWATDDEVKTASLNLEFEKPIRFNRFLVQEYISLGQRVRSFALEAFVDGDWMSVAKGSTIGYKRILRFPSIEAKRIRFRITDSKACPLISNVGVFNAPLMLDVPTMYRSQQGAVTISTTDIGPILYYSTDGSEPTTDSLRYDGPFVLDGKVTIRAIAHDPDSGRSSSVGQVRFDVSKRHWTLVGIDDTSASAVLDGNPHTVWHQGAVDGRNTFLTIDLGQMLNLSGFRYLPDQNKWSRGIITKYRFQVSRDGLDWQTAKEGEFSNIRNNPVWQINRFSPVLARFIRLSMLGNTAGDAEAGYAEIEVITDQP